MPGRIQMENYQGNRMRISWVFSNDADIDPCVEIEQLKNIGPFWGGWRTWRSYATDNVICHDVNQALDLVNKNFHTRCNLYVPMSTYQVLDRPRGVNLYQGEFNHDMDSPDDIVSMHLATSKSDIILMVGFKLEEPHGLDQNKLAKHKWINYQNYLKQIIVSTPDIQWVFLDCPGENKEFKKMSNCQFDTLKNVLTQFN